MTKSPECPNPRCRAKFAHSREKLACNKCGLPDEIAALGPRAVSRWLHKTAGKRKHNGRVSTINRRRKTHGRR